jgi:UPF0755 protein
MIKVKNIHKFLLGGAVAFFLAILCGILYVKNYLGNSINIKDKFIYVEKGSGTNKIIKQLAEEKVIDRKFLFKTVLLFKTRNKSIIKYGEYFFKKDVKIREVIDILLTGKNYLRSIMFAEGLTNYSILKMINENEFLSGSPIDYQIPEGVLLPETYFFQKGDPREGLLKEMWSSLMKLLQSEWENRDKSLPYRSMKEALTMASIIEKETGVDEERELVASVFVNRLRINMPLQTDPTSIYGYTMGDITKEKDVKTHVLLRENSPYNTYKNKGLPPTPICNSGKKSILAAFHPAKTDYLFFVATGNGGHVFAKDYKEHLKNIEKLKKNK